MFVVTKITLVLVISGMAILNCERDAKQTEKAANVTSTHAAKSEAMYQFDARTRTHSQPMDRNEKSPERIKFVYVDVAEVVNPKKHPIAFNVHYAAADGNKVLLGSFALYPSDNPGDFIVPTSGKLKSEGSLVLSLDVPESANDDAQLRIRVKKIRLKER